MENPSIENILASRPSIEHFILLDAGFLLKEIAKIALHAHGINPQGLEITRGFRGDPVITIINPTGLQELLIDSARSVLDKETTSNKAHGILWYDASRKDSDGRRNFTSEHETIRNIPGVFLRFGDLVLTEGPDGQTKLEQRGVDPLLTADLNTLAISNRIKSIVLVAGDKGFHPRLQAVKNADVAVLGIGNIEFQCYGTAWALRKNFKFSGIDPARLFEIVQANPAWIDFMRAKAQQRSAVERTITVNSTQKPEIYPPPRRLSRSPYQLLRHRRIRVAYPNITEEKQENQSHEGSPPIFSSEHDVSGQDFTRVIETKNHPVPISEPPQPEPSRASKEPQNEDEWSGFKKALLWGLGAIAAIAYAVNR